MGKKLISPEEYERRLRTPGMSYGQYIRVYADEELMCVCKYPMATKVWKTDKKTGKSVCAFCGGEM